MAGAQHSLGPVCLEARIDPQVRQLVQMLNQVRGTTTRASCEGGGPCRPAHRHAEAAYVAFRQPLPLQFQAFLLTKVGAVARVEDDGIYSRWPERNSLFITTAVEATRTYLAQPPARSAGVCWPLPKLRARLARQLSSEQGICVQLCLQCGDLVFDPHTEHRSLPLVCGAAEEEASWLAAFTQQPGNALEPGLIAADGWNQLLARTRRGDFGLTFQRRWLRYRTRRLTDLATRQMRVGAEEARGVRPDLDFFYNQSEVVFEWSPE